MNKKYLLRGIGIGLVVAAGIMYGSTVALGSEDTSSKDNKNDTKIEVEAVDVDNDIDKIEVDIDDEKATEATTEEKTTEEKTTEEKTTEITTEATTEAATEERTESVTEEEKTEEKEETTEKASDEEKSSDKDKTDKNEKVSITVTSGMTSETVSQLLKDAGLVESATEYNSWLITKGYDAKLHIGTFEIKKDASNEEIARLLMTEGE